MMDRAVFLLVCLVTLVSASSSGIPPQIIHDDDGNIADKESNITWAPLPTGSNYSSDITANDGGLRPLYEMAKKFLAVVQPNPFPYDLINQVLAGDMSAVLNDPMTVVTYAMGFAICFAIGILFVIIMPIVGCCFCCCRICGNCGGKKIQRSSDVNNCHRIAFTVLVFVMATFIMIPAACSLYANETTSKTMNNVGPLIVNNINDLETFLNNTILQLNHIALTNYNFTGKVMSRDLDNIGVLLGEEIRDSMKTQMNLDAAFNKIKALDVSLQALATTLNSADTNKGTFETEANTLKTQLGVQETNIINTKTKANCPSESQCSNLDTSVLAIDANPTNLASITAQVNKINSAKSKNLTSEWNTAMKDFEEIPTKVTADSETMRADVKKMIDDFYTTISDSLKSIEGLTSNLGMLTNTKNTIQSTAGEVKTYDKYRWYGGVALASVLFLIGGLQYLGCIIGACSYSSRTAPTDRGCLSNSSGAMLMASVGFCFIFSWLLMLLTSITFLIGGNMEKLACEPLMDPSYKIFKELIDKPDGPLGEGYFLGDMLLQDKTANLTMHGILDGCKNAGSAYNVLMLSHMFNLTELTDYKSKMDIEKQMKDSNNIDLSSVKVMTPSLKQTLEDFQAALNIDFATMITELSKDAAKTGLTAYADGLIAIANLPSMASSPAVNELITEAAALKNIDNNQVPKVNTAKAALIVDLQALQTQAPNVQADITAVTTALNDLDTYITNSAPDLINTKMLTYVTRLLGIIDSFVARTLDSVKNDVGICTPLWNLYNSILGTIVCKSVIDTLNGFWFSFGWATVFFIPAMIFSVKLNKYLRRCDYCGPDDGRRGKKGKPGRKNKDAENYLKADSPIYSNKVAPGDDQEKW
ncbi:prominin-1-A-like isoform X3 [Lineus longissimus]|uniref:prominin-1-A-like isoform X3 n=2 Tax=Lineus longissimus TaxID=88925 RepID=UPI00315CC202